MVRFDILGFSSFEEYSEYFFKTLLPSNRTYEYFVDWEKIRRTVYPIRHELALLNYLTMIDRNQRDTELREILVKYPKLVRVIPILLALRGKEIDVLDLESGAIQFKKISFSEEDLDSEKIDEVIEFVKKSGLMEMFDVIKDILSYVYGVEVGLDSNARKNRSGTIFQKLVTSAVKQKIMKTNKQLSITLKEEDQNVLTRRGKRADIVLYEHEKPKMVIEVNFFGVSGSKPLETARSYVELYKRLREEGITFVWVTDGPAWKKMKSPLLRALKEIDYLINYHILIERFDRIIEKELV